MTTSTRLIFHVNLSLFQVRTFYRKCNKGRATCNCAVAVRSGDDVIVIDRCGPTSTAGKYKALKITLYLNGELTKGTKVLAFGGGKKYEVSSLGQSLCLKDSNLLRCCVAATFWRCNYILWSIKHFGLENSVSFTISCVFFDYCTQIILLMKTYRPSILSRNYWTCDFTGKFLSGKIMFY